jgi:aspartate--tRNA ligase
MYRTHNCNELRIENIGEEVTIAGFVSKIRNYGGLTFIDIRDHYGITQVVIRDEKLIEKYSKVPAESTIRVKGKVVERENKNPNIPTGDIEINGEEIEVLGRAKVNLPFEINSDYRNNKEDLRLQYRFLDLRNSDIHKNIILRSKIMKDARNYMDSLGFVEIQTPIFANSSPEGARDYLIPSRLHKGEFYALPQAPQQFKQLLMMSGFDKYYQIAPCFRDEDPRADRSPCEFYQIDFEMSFAEQEDVLKVIEGLLYNVFSKNTDKKVDNVGFRRISYNDSLEYFGIDKPDLRNVLLNVNISKEMEEIRKDATIIKENTYCIVIPKILTRKEYDKIVEEVKKETEEQIYYYKVQDGEISGGISKFVTGDLKNNILEKNEKVKEIVGTKDYIAKERLLEFDNNNHSVFIITNSVKEKAEKVAGITRIKLGQELDIIEKDTYRFCFIVDFPMYELNDEGKIDFAHNPFSMPQISKEDITLVDPLSIKAYQYDAVCNGFEVTSGAVRNYDIEMMEKVFKIAGYSKEDLQEKFKALYTAFEYGAMPHAGAAPGLDRLVMLLAEETSIREVIAFPKNKKARDLMVNAPSKISEEQLKELHIQMIKNEDKD